jgi:hypothetical protein
MKKVSTYTGGLRASSSEQWELFEIDRQTRKPFQSLQVFSYVLTAKRTVVKRKKDLNNPKEKKKKSFSSFPSRLVFNFSPSINSINLHYKSIFCAHFQEPLAAEGNLHNMNIFSPSMIRQLDSLANRRRRRRQRSMLERKAERKSEK